MRLTCNIYDLRRALAFVSQGIVGKSAILDTLLRILVIAGEDGRLQLSVGSAALQSTYYIDARVEEPGSIHILLQALSEFANDPAGVGDSCSLSSREISSAEERLAVMLVRGGQRTTIEETSAPLYQEYRESEEAESFALPVRLLSEMIAQVIFAASEDEHVPVRDRPFLNVWLQLPGDETLTFAACDQSQLALRKVKAPGAIVPHATLQVAREAFATLAALLTTVDGGDGEVRIVPEVEQRQLRFLLPQAEVALSLAETDLLLGRYDIPFAPFEKLIPTVFPARCTTRIIVPADRLRAALKAASGLVRCAQKNGESGKAQLYLEIYRKGSEKVNMASVPIVRWSGLHADSIWFDASYLKQALSCPGTTTLVALELGKTATSPVVVRWIDDKTTNKNYAYAFAVLDPYLALLSTRAHHVLSQQAQQLAGELPQRMAERGEWVERRYLRNAILREIIRILDCGLPPFHDDVRRIAASAPTKKLLAQERLEKLSFAKKREHERRLASVSELIAILAFAEEGYEVPGFGMRIEAACVQGAFLAMKEIGV